MQQIEIKSTDTVEIYRDKAGEYRWRLTQENGEIIAASTESYSSEKGAKNNLMRDRSADVVEVYTDKAGEWRWKAFSRNGNRVAAATEGYSSKVSCLSILERNGYQLKQIKEE